MKKSIKRSIAALFTCAAAALTSAGALSAPALAAEKTAAVTTETTAEQTYKVKFKKVKTYIFLDLPETTIETNLYFVNGSDVPYLDIEEWIDMRMFVNNFLERDNNFKLTAKKKGDIIRIKRETGFWAQIDCKKDTISFLDYNAFNAIGDNNIIDLVQSAFTDDNNKPVYIKRLTSENNTRFGKSSTFDFSEYGIDFVHYKDKYLVPAQTISDVFLSWMLCSFLYNGRSLIYYSSNVDTLVNDDGSYTDLGKIYYKKSGERSVSKEMAEFNYSELCFVFDHLYGLKEAHHLESFDDYVEDNALKDYFLNEDSAFIDAALYAIITRTLDDIHSDFSHPSYQTGIEVAGKMNESFGKGRSFEAYVEMYREFFTARAAAFPEGLHFYEEYGDTAYITLDEFLNFTNNYYENPSTGSNADTIGNISYAVQQILRKNSPIKNVVLDLSMNGGGSTDAAVYTLGAFLGKATIDLEDPNTGALVTCNYKVDTNLDHKFNSKDTLAGKGLNLYCLTSPLSFSCGNLVPSIFKYSNKVTLLGQTTGGGACTVLPLTSAIGSVFNISSSMRMSYLKNGSYYDVDQGVAPDYTISRIEHFYDREALTEYIHNLF